MFGKLRKLSVLDLSFNNFQGNLPQSLGSLSNLDTLHLQDNGFTGSVNVLASLPLVDLNIENNHFSGSIPGKLKGIKKIKSQGNSFSPGLASRSSNTSTSSHNQRKNGEKHPGIHNLPSENQKVTKESDVSKSAIAGIVIAVLATIVLLLVLFSRKSKSRYLNEEKLSQNRSFTSLATHEFRDIGADDVSSPIRMKTMQTSLSMGLKPPSLDRHGSFNDNAFARESSIKKNMLPNNVIAYSLSDLQTVTGNFNMEHLVGEGLIGCVYKVQYADGKVMAIKRMESALIQRSNSENFMEMISNISRMRHPNITELIGYCIEHGHCLLIYQFLKNGSLHAFLHLSDDYSKPLTWNTRIRIALGTARAIEYLHEVCSPSSVHKNIKSANILLDSELNPHLSDCGLAIFYENINQIMGIGYKAPECTGPSGYTIKSDVYSFGVVMLELLTGRPPFNSSKTRDEQYLVNWAVPKLHDIDALDKMVDPALHGLYPPKSLSRFADVIALCVQPEPEFRPPMSEVVHALVRVIQSDNSVRTSMNKRTGDYSDCPYY